MAAHRQSPLVAPLVDAPVDQLGRVFQDLRVSVTDRCNFRCPYCMPKEIFGPGYQFLPRADILSFEEIVRLTSVFARLGLRKLRLTGGEPTVRAELPTLVRMLRQALPGVDLALTTNGSRLALLAEDLAQAGLNRVTVSLDAIDPEVSRRMNGVDFPLERVLAGIDAAAAAGLAPVKINSVIQRGMNEGEITRLAEHFRGSGHIVRFIEYMDVARRTAGSWTMWCRRPRSSSGCNRRCRWSRSSRPIAARWRDAGAGATARARSG